MTLPKQECPYVCNRNKTFSTLQTSSAVLFMEELCLTGQCFFNLCQSLGVGTWLLALADRLLNRGQRLISELTGCCPSSDTIP